MLADRRGAVGVLFGLLAPVLILGVAFAIDVTAWYRDALHLQQLADRAAASAGPYWHDGDRDAAAAVATAVADVDELEVRIDRLANPAAGRWARDRRALEIVVSSDQQHLLAGLFAASRQSAGAVAFDDRLVE